MTEDHFDSRCPEDRLFDERIIFLSGDIDKTSSQRLATDLMALSISSKDPIHLYINSGGGCVSSGLMIYDFMQHIQPEVYTYCVGICASMAAIILAGGSKGNRYILPNGLVMIHRLTGGSSGHIDDVTSELEIMKKLELAADKILSKHTKKPVSKIKKDCMTDKWFDSKEALKYGFVDNIINK